MSSDLFGFFVKIEHFLFGSLTIETTADLFVACLVMCLIAVVYEGLRALRELVLRYREDAHLSNNAIDERIRLQGETSFKPRNFREWFGYNLLQSALHMLQLILNYTLMLSVMTYNAWITVAVIVGAGLGFFILAPLSIYRNNIKNTQRYSPKINIISDYSSMDTSLNWLQTSGSDRLQAH